ncbi:hypothetical protein N2152v2_008464 [Parachlorella kessleri]
MAAAAAAEEAAPEAAGAALQAAAEQVAGGDFSGAAAAVADQLGGTDPGNVVISILFTTAIAALTVLTLGVAYLSFTSWNDSRLEAEDRKKAGGLSPVASGSRQPGSGSSKKAKKSPQEAADFKGFGPKK